MNTSFLFMVVGLAFYILASRWILRSWQGIPREAGIALVNLAGVFLCFFYDLARPHHIPLAFAIYVVIVILQYVTLRWFANRPGKYVWLAFFTPLLVLVIFRYIPQGMFTAASHVMGWGSIGLPSLIGLSYLAFRCSRLALEVRDGFVPMPGLWGYLGFAFFLPTMPVGPINTYANYRRGFAATPWEVPVGRAVLRIMVGAVKFKFLSGVFSELGYDGLLRNGHLHPWIHLPIAMVFYFLFLYCNFSGFCDMAIGASALIGIPVPENFETPFAARNMKDFWNRWHITLSQWMRDIVFAPLSKYLVRLMGPPQANHAIAITITVVFLLVGTWHGVGWNFVIFGGIHAVGLVMNHYYTIGLKKMLGREGFKTYMGSLWIHCAAVVFTFAYCAVSLLFFANTFPQIKAILASLR